MNNIKGCIYACETYKEESCYLKAFLMEKQLIFQIITLSSFGTEFWHECLNISTQILNWPLTRRKCRHYYSTVTDEVVISQHLAVGSLRDVVDAPCLELFKAQLGGALTNLLY